MSGSIVGAYYNRWGIRRATLKIGKRSWLLPSNSYLLTMGSVMVATLLLCLVGPDHLPEGTGIWEFKSLKNYVGYRAPVYSDYKAELLRPKHHDVAGANLWAAGNRFGFMAFATMPFIVLLALKSGPFGIFTNKYFTGLHWDKVGTFHRAGGWFVWWLTTIHVGLWLVKLFKEHRDGTPMFICMTIASRFRCAIVAYLSMTGAMFMSIRWVRNRIYEAFYLSHVVLILFTFVFATVHHHVIGYWLGACLTLWAGDRFTRWIRTAYFNGFLGTAEARKNDKVPDVEDRDLDAPRVIPVGYAQAQMLPSKMIRLSIRTHRPMHWSPGQSLLLTLPELSQITTHPFSIANNDPNEIVIMVKAQTGLTLDLYNTVKERMKSLYSPNDIDIMGALLKAPAIDFKVRIDGPFGSAGRVPWGDYSTILVVCGGSGITFGMAISDHLSRIMGTPNCQTTRLRFVWIARHKADVAWIGSFLCRLEDAMAHLPYVYGRPQLEINLHITDKSSLDVKAKKNIEGSTASLLSGYDADSDDEKAKSNAHGNSHGHGHGNTHLHPNAVYGGNGGADADDDRAYTLYDGERDDPHSSRLSRRLYETNKQRRISRRISGMPDGIGGGTLSARYNDEWHDAKPQPPRAGTHLTVEDPFDDSNPFEPKLPPIRGSPAMSLRSQDSSATLAENRPPFNSSNPWRSTATATDEKKAKETYFFPKLNASDTSFSSRRAVLRRTQNMILIDDTPDAVGTGHCTSCGHKDGTELWVDEADFESIQVWEDRLIPGRPVLKALVEEEMEHSPGQTIIATCGPAKLNTDLRNIVSSCIKTKDIREGKPNGYVTMYSEDFEM
jgi:hypothetical protein